MNPTAVAALVCGAAALLRHAAALPLLLRYLARARVSRIPRGPTPPLSLLKPLYGAEPGLEENLVATLRQNYPAFEVLFLHERPEDPARGAARAAAARVPDVPVRFLAGRDDSASNPKVAVLLRGEAEAREEILVASDSDIRPDPLFLRDVANGLAERDLVFFPPVLFGAASAAARLNALFVNVEGFLSILLAGGRFVVGATIGVRREALRAAGGYRAVADRIADDADLGRAFRRAGRPAALARRAARCHAPGGSLREVASQTARWARTVRTAAPLLYLAALPVAFAPVALLAHAIAGGGAPPLLALLLHSLVRASVAAAVEFRFVWDRSLLRAIPLLPLLWIVEPAVWIAGLFGRTVRWRGRTYRVAGGRATLLPR